jgi:pyrroline-5-carboxylate reductase
MSIKTLGFIGAGNMTGAIVKGLLASGFAPANLILCNRTPAKLAAFADLGCIVTTDAEEAVALSDALVLAVKPQLMKSVLLPLTESVQQRQPLILSVAAAIGEASINHWLGGGLAIIRTMPNTPALVQAGATGLFANGRVTEAHKEFAQGLFAGIGQYRWVDPETLIHSVTAAAGSAPAYFFRFAQAMSKTAQAQGLDEDQARVLIGQTMLGAAKMILETDEPLEQMCQKVCSPKGTTERAIQSFEASDIDLIVEKAMTACFERSQELAELLAD